MTKLVSFQGWFNICKSINILQHRNLRTGITWSPKRHRKVLGSIISSNDKSPGGTGNRRTISQYNKHYRPIYSTLSGEELKAFSLKSGMKQLSSKQKEQSGEHCNISSQTMFQSYSNKTVWYWCKNRHRTEEPKINEHGYSCLVFGKGVPKNIHCRKVSFFNKWYWENKTGYLHIQERNWIHTSYPIINKNGLKILM